MDPAAEPPTSPEPAAPSDPAASPDGPGSSAPDPAAPGPGTRTLSRRPAVVAGIGAMLGALLMLVALTVAGSAGLISLTGPAARSPAGAGATGERLAHGEIVLLAGTPHYWVADQAGVLHWPADTRALAGRYVRWDAVREVGLADLQRLPRGEPWLTHPGAFIRGRDRTLYLVRWDTGMRWPVPLRLPPLPELALFGLTASLVDANTQDEDTWERLNELSLEDAAIEFTRVTQPSAAPTSPSASASATPSPAATRPPTGASSSSAPSPAASAAAVLPFGWRTGTYSGTGIQEFPDDTYPVSFTLSPLRPDPLLGIVAGTVNYVSFPCGGPVGLLSVTPDRLELTERFTAGLEHCTDQGRVTLERRSDTRVFYTWTLPAGTASRTLVTGFLFREAT